MKAVFDVVYEPGELRALAVLSSGAAGQVIIPAGGEGFRPGRCVMEFA